MLLVLAEQIAVLVVEFPLMDVVKAPPVCLTCSIVSLPGKVVGVRTDDVVVVG